MRFFHLSDLHIGLKLFGRDLQEDQEYILKQIVEKAVEERPDAMVIAGDIYDKAVPSAEAVKVFDRFLLDLTSALPELIVMMISGNHDSTIRVNYLRGILSRQKVYMIGIPPQSEDEYIEKLTMKDTYGEVNFYLLPFIKPSMVKNIVGTDEKGNNFSYDETIRRMLERETIDTKVRNVLVSHQFYLPSGMEAGKVERMDSEICTVGNIDEVSAQVLEPFDYAALGHIHKPMKVGKENYRYCGTPLACSVSEAGQQKGILMVEMQEKGVTQVQVLPLVPLRQVRILKGELQEVLQQSCEDYVTVILTDKIDFDICDMQDRLRSAFPNLLEIRREHIRKADYDFEDQDMEMMSAFDLCLSFLKDLEEEERNILQEVINNVQGEQ